MSLQRRPNWPTLFYRFIEDHEDAPFEYGRTDCGLWVADAILQITGTDLAKCFRGRYNTRKELIELVKSETGTGSSLALALKITVEHHMPEVPTLCAQRGDLVLLKRPHDYSFGIVGLDGTVLGISSTGFTRLPLTQAFRAWRV